MGVEGPPVKDVTMTSMQSKQFIKKYHHMHMTKLKQGTEAIRPKKMQAKIILLKTLDN